jgi:hypothetical protein
MMKYAVIILILIASVTVCAGTQTKSGYLDGTDDFESWDLNLTSKVVDVVFTWPLGSEYWVTVYGMYGDELGTFNLEEGETIQLSGGGKFTVKVFSVKGSGSWTATWKDGN